jgi:hypothetical protein
MGVAAASDRFLIFAVLAAFSLFSLGQIIFDNLVYAQLMHELEQHIGALGAEMLSRSSSIALSLLIAGATSVFLNVYLKRILAILSSCRRSRRANPHLVPNARRVSCSAIAFVRRTLRPDRTRILRVVSHDLLGK